MRRYAYSLGLGSPRLLYDAGSRTSAWWSTPLVPTPKGYAIRGLENLADILRPRIAEDELANAFDLGKQELGIMSAIARISSLDNDGRIIVIPDRRVKTGWIAKVALNDHGLQPLDRERAVLNRLARTRSVPMPQESKSQRVLIMEEVRPLVHPSFAKFVATLQRVGDSLTDVRQAAPTCEACRSLFADWDDALTLWHGDFTPWNVATTIDGSPIILDWELSDPFVLVPRPLIEAQWQLRTAASRGRSLRLRDELGKWAEAYICFDTERKQIARKNDKLIRDRLLPFITAAKASGHRLGENLA